MAEFPQYRLGFTGHARQALARLLSRADALGIRERLEACFARIEVGLQTRPLEWGEPKYRIQSMSLLCCVGFDDRIRLNYGVHEHPPAVFVNGIEAELGHPLFAPPDA